MRPPGPEPSTRARSTPSSSATRRTRGVALLGPPRSARSRGAAAAGSFDGFGSSAGGAGAISAGVSPATSSIVHSPAPIGTVSPSATRISTTVPETGDGSSTFTLSVLTSTIGSYFATLSPGALSHFSIVPSVTVSPTSGSVSVYAML